MPDQRLRDTWLIRRREALELLVVYVVFTVAWFVVGWVLTRPLKNSVIVHGDQSAAEWFVERRTPRLDSLSFAGSMLSETIVKVIVTAIVALAMLIAWKRWLEPLVVVVALILEALSFITITALVGRNRPDVPHLDSSPVGSSYPSGHVGAAVAYSAIVVVIFWHTRRRWIRALSVVIAVAIPVCVALARLYRGMHFVTDVVFGALLGTASVVATVIVLKRAAKRQGVQIEIDESEPVPDLVSS